MLIKAETKMPFSEDVREDNSRSHWETKHFKLVLDVKFLSLSLSLLLLLLLKVQFFWEKKNVEHVGNLMWGKANATLTNCHHNVVGRGDGQRVIKVSIIGNATTLVKSNKIGL